jgi:hypothetical protein
MNQQLAAVRRLAHEAADAGLLSQNCGWKQPGERVKQPGFPRRELDITPVDTAHNSTSDSGSTSD